ncbi:S-adenosyl-L-methionine-dependent methyltransferase [Glarea lozoyensis ATCC 20868]|uniref:S-adenosyl-L-methionine-dependent methyltransferase n=1 Tax=Glarea lozoyensis (strain ATCC 20868 / MF5171) TaxID=1116229 RepID=S3CX04_GLAL2|nr:S-adenosyl-L-methionine-dependent methyltransferase [Glarea lozoyensis ATCC 20868]EPE30170.1 S-adenosyl-L-methionine-dependent methyltransferase [Glarea lozoyensis ATCC 20868]
MSTQPPPPFRPRQCLPLSPKIMQELMGDVTLQIARQIVNSTPLNTGAIILDNGCGNGVVTQAITETKEAGDITIHATDVVPPLVQATAALAASKGWADSVKAEVMPAEALSFGDNYFTDSFNNFLIFLVKDPEKVASHIYRTLKPGGTAIVTTWASVAHHNPILKANNATRGEDAFHAYKEGAKWQSADHLKSVLEGAGFKDIKMSQSDAVLQIPDLKRWSEVAWSFLGAPKGPAGGWVESDEERFDEAVAVVKRAMEDEETITVDGKGGAAARMIAHIAVAKK